MDVESILNQGGAVYPPRWAIATAWMVSGVGTQREIASLLGIHRNSLAYSREFLPFREAWASWKSAKREDKTACHPSYGNQAQ